MEQPYFLIHSVTRTLEIMEYLSKKGEAGVSEVSSHLGVNMSTAHRFLASIKYFGYAEQNETNQKYKLSMKVFELGNRIVANLDVRDIAKPLMYQLADQTGETINLGIIDQSNIVYIDKVLSKNVLRPDSPIGGRDQIHSTALGKAMAAFYSLDYIERYIEGVGLVRITSKTIVDKNKFLSELEEVRKQGYAIDSEETILGLKCIAAPIFNKENRPIASISISGVKDRVNKKNLEGFKELILSASKELSKQLGSDRFNNV